MGDEIDLVALLQSLWAQKWLIALVTLVVTLGAASYAFLSKPIYESRIAVLPPTLSDIAGFNLGRDGRSGLKPFSVGDIYTVFTRNLQAEDSRRQFFRDVYLPSLDEEQRSGSQDRLYQAFAKVLSVKAPNKSQPDRYVIAVEHRDPAQAANWAKHYMDQVTRQSLDEMLQNIRREVEVKGRQVQQEIETLREFVKIRKNDRIFQLKEALTVAEAVGLANPPVISGQIAEQLSAIMNGDLMYMRGSKALRAEIEALENRTSDDPFIPSLRNLEEQYDFYAGIQVVPEKVAISRQDGAVVTPDAPIKPKKALILVLGILLGGMLGVFIALVRLMLSKNSATAQVLPTSISQSVGAT
ncbi:MULTISPECIES: Wzz/FepE/Etk N-terminal domain-containing protein [unclassified Microbulbifer]|uniref:LPS O-antigen chain length determinant protein WzzB n=1 Tax=unclassified Microbulbifer TaxID=2619833 RepID=UPI0027E58878|nr:MULTISPECIES: Wzz/FepE/Etk N-terminal domain-containing protein [unclassified Microbulbifer]